VAFKITLAYDPWAPKWHSANGIQAPVVSLADRGLVLSPFIGMASEPSLP
jgi:hypothetical protein